MKIFHTLPLLLAISALGASHHDDYSSLRITPEYTQYTLGELVSVKSQMEFKPTGYVRYQNPAEEHFDWWCKGDGGEYEKIYFLHSVHDSPIPRRMERLPLSYNYGFGLPAFKSGALICRIQGKYLLVRQDGGRAIFMIISNAITIEVRPPNPEDEIILKELGIYENYMNGQPTANTVQGTLGHGMFDYLKHPDSSYYCHAIARNLRDIFQAPRSVRAGESYSDIPIVWNPHNHNQEFLERSRWIDLLEKSDCAKISPAEFAYWRTSNALLLGEFDDAIRAAKQGLALNPCPAYKAFFERLLKTPTVGEYLRQFKVVTDQQGNPVKF